MEILLGTHHETCTTFPASPKLSPSFYVLDGAPETYEWWCPRPIKKKNIYIYIHALFKLQKYYC